MLPIQIPKGTNAHAFNSAKLKTLHHRTEGSYLNKKQSSYTSEPRRTSTTVLGHVLPLKFCQRDKGSKSPCYQDKTKQNSSERVRTQTDNNGNTQNRFRNSPKSKCISKNCSGKSTFDKVQTSAGTMPKASVTFRFPTDEKCQKYAR